MEKGGNFIPLGAKKLVDDTERAARYSSSKVIGKTKEERSRIAREVRLKARREKKFIKAEAKRQRKQNAVLHRRATRNNEKYTKNADRNKQRAIDFERSKIHLEAVRQAEKLAAIHDPSGKSFNVGKIIVLNDGSIRTEQGLQKAEEARAKREAAAKKRKDDEAYRKSVMESTRETIREEEEKAKARGLTIDVERRMRELTAHLKLPHKISKKQLERQEQLKKLEEPVPPKPILPEGFILTLAPGEENWISLWDLDDAAVTKRINQKKKDDKLARKHLRDVQAEQKKVNKAMKTKKKQYANAGVIWDPEKAKAEILGLTPATTGGTIESDTSAEPKSDSGSGRDPDSSSNTSSDSDSDDETGKTNQPKKKKLAYMKPLKINMELLQEAEAVKQALLDKKRARRTARRTARKEKEIADEKKAGEASRLEAEEKAKARAERKAAKAVAKEAQAVAEAPALEDAKAPESKKRKRNGQDQDDDVAAAERKKARKEEKRAKKEAEEDAERERPHKGKMDAEAEKRAVEKAAKKEEKRRGKAERNGEAMDIDIPANGNNEISTEKHEKKRMAESNDVKLDHEITERKAQLKAELGSDDDEGPQYDEQSGTAQWNPDALSGGDARKDKFLKLLGAKKEGSADKISRKPTKENGNAIDISKVQNELERQFESGIKMKHDGGSKRRGLGA